MLPTAGGKEDRERERKKELRMTEHESRKCNERRSGSVMSSLINIKAAFVENEIIKTKNFSHMSS